MILARILSSLLMIVHGAKSEWVKKNIASLASVYSSHLSLDIKSIGLTFHCLSGSLARFLNLLKLLPTAYREVELDQMNSAVHDHSLQYGRLSHKEPVLGIR